MYTREDETRLVIRNGEVYRIQFHHDSDATNPWEDCDGMVPLLTDNADFSQGHDIENPLDYMSIQFIARHSDEIAGILDMALFDVEFNISDFMDMEGYGRGDARLETFREILDGMPKSDRFDAIAELWNLAGVPAESTCVNGYTQGHYTNLLFVAHPDAIKSWGFKSIAAYVKKCGDGFEGERRTYAAWAFGDVMGYTVETIPMEEIKLAGFDSPHDMEASDANGMTYCEHVDSCWGFFPVPGRDFDQEYVEMISEAMDSIPSEKETNK